MRGGFPGGMHGGFGGMSDSGNMPEAGGVPGGMPAVGGTQGGMPGTGGYVRWL